MLDIDHFKKFNDTYGHQTGDMVLKTLGSLIDKLTRDSDLSARYGGEEFALLMYHTGPQEAFMVAERLREAVEQHKFQTDNQVLTMTISIGVVSFPHPEIANAKAMIECADKAMYQAKEEGRNRVVVF